MPARIRKTTLNDEWRNKIRVSMLINRLESHATGEIELSPTQVRSIEILLKKVAPDLQSIEHTGEIDHRYVAEVPQVSENSETWQQQHTPPSLQ